MFSESKLVKAGAFLLLFISPAAISNSEHLICLSREISDPLFATTLAEAEASQSAFAKVNSTVLISETDNDKVGVVSHSVKSSGIFSSSILKEYVNGNEICFIIRTHKKTPT